MSKKQKPTSSDVGANVLGELDSFVKKVTALVGNPPALTAADMKRATKLRKGGEKVIPTIAALANQFGLTIASHPVEAMVGKMNQASSLAPLHKKLVAATKQVGDAIFQAQSESWESAAVHYATLRYLAVKDGDVAKTLAPVTQYFSRRSSAVVDAEDAKRGGKKGSNAAKAAKAQAKDAEAPGSESPAPAAAPAATQTATPSPTAPAAASAPVSAPHS
jgi:hypothetical protein